MGEYAALGPSPSPIRDSARYDEGKNGRPKLNHSIGPTRLSILFAGTTFMLTAAILLTLLWAGAAAGRSQGKPGQAWDFIVDRGWAPITVTVCSAIIRLTVTIQAGLAMSMMASILLERRRVELGDTVFLSIVRAVSIQPLDFLLIMGRSIRKTSGILSFSLVFIMGLIAVVSTFTSSILLSDFGNISIVRGMTTSSIGASNDNINSAVEIWRSPPRQYGRFAEYMSDDGRIVSGNIDDTGVTLRAAMPLASSQERETLRSYTGPATVFDHRVICLAPQLTLQRIHRIGSSDESGQGAFGFGRVSLEGYATFSSDLPPPLRGSPEAGNRLPFNCAFSGTTQPTNGLLWNISICSVQHVEPITALSAPLNMSRSIYQPHKTPSYIPSIFFILNITMPTASWSKFSIEQFPRSNSTAFAFPRDSVVTSLDGPWTRATTQGVSNLDGAIFSLTACVSTTEGSPHIITATSPSDGAEPSLTWAGTLTPYDSATTTKNTTTTTTAIPQFTYNTSSIRRQLNTLSNLLSPVGRGILTLHPSLTNWSDRIPSRFDESTIHANLLFPTHPTLPLCTTTNKSNSTSSPSSMFMSSPPECRTNPTGIFVSVGAVRDVGHPAHISLIYDSLIATGSPARALQGWLTVVARERFYDALTRFAESAEARYVRSTTVFAPARWDALVGVLAMVGAHVLCMVFVTVWFARATTHSVLGSSWVAVGQVVNETTAGYLRRAVEEGLTDGEVRRVIATREQEGMGTGMGTGRYKYFGIAARDRKTGRGGELGCKAGG